MAQPLRIKTDTDERIYNTEAYFMASPIIWTPSQTLIPIDGSDAGKRKVGNNVDTYADLDFENSGAVGSYSPPIPQSEVTDLESDLSDIVAQAARDRHPVVTFSTNTNTAQDPGQATIRFNNGTIASVTEIALSDADSEGIDKGDLNSRCAGIIQLRTVASAATIEFQITGVVHTSWTRYTVTYLKGSLPSNGTVLAVRFLPVSVVTQTITNGETATAPSEDAVFDALALKAPRAIIGTSGSSTAVLVTITGLTDGSGRLGVDFTAASGSRPAFSAVYFLGGGLVGVGRDIIAMVHDSTLSDYSVKYWDVPGAAVASADVDVSATFLGIPA